MGICGNGALKLVLQAAGACVIAFALDNLIPAGSFLLGMVPLWPLVFFVNLFTERACMATFVGGLMIDSIHLSIPFGLSAIVGICMLLLLKIFHVCLKRDIKARWVIFLVIYTLCYYTILACILPGCHLLSFFFAMISSIAYNCILWVVVFRGHEMAHFQAICTRCT